MPLNYMNLDARTRQFMREEVIADINAGTLYLSSRLSAKGAQDWPGLLRDAATSGSDATLAAELRLHGRLNQTEERKKPKGGFTVAQVPVTAPETMAEGEFNRFYIRGLCQRAIADGIGNLVIYRARGAGTPRPESVAKIGSTIDPQALLHDLRTHSGVDTALGLPPGPNSGLSARLP